MTCTSNSAVAALSALLLVLGVLSNGDGSAVVEEGSPLHALSTTSGSGNVEEDEYVFFISFSLNALK